MYREELTIYLILPPTPLASGGGLQTAYFFALQVYICEVVVSMILNYLTPSQQHLSPRLSRTENVALNSITPQSDTSFQYTTLLLDPR